MNKFPAGGDFSWDNWKPQYLCTTCYILDGRGNVLLIERKKKGFGNGKVAAPGGHLEEGETLEACIIRETLEEVGLTISALEHVGILNFAIPDNNFTGHVFLARKFTGEVFESLEARPFWAPVDKLPFSRMFDDDSIWLPDALKGRHFELFAQCDVDGNLLSYNYRLLGENG